MHSVSPISSASIFPVPSRARLVFVDDDELVLRSLQRLLRGYGRGWDLSFTTDARRALATLDQKPVDVLVCDLRMAVAGTTVLAEAQAAHPDVARIIITGESELKKILPCIPLAHQFLAKPYDPARFTGTLERICALRRVVGNSVVRSIVGSSNGLPAAPRVHGELTAALQGAHATTADIAAIVEHDVGISTRLLQLASSPSFGPPHGVFSIQAAVASLGLDTIRTLVLSSDIVRPLDPRGVMSGFSLSVLGEHSLRTARIARAIARASGDHAYVAGLLHNVGQVLLAARMPHRFAEAIDRSRATGSGLLVVERDVLGLTHAELGAYLLGLWGFRRSTIEAVVHYPDPEKAGASFTLAGALHIASILADDPGAPLGGEPSMEMTHVPGAYLARLGLLSALPEWRRLAAEVR